MTGKQIKIGETYRYSQGRNGTYFSKVKVTKILDVSKWDRKDMKYITIPGKVEIEFDNGGKSECRFQDIIETWAEFKARDPQKVASYDYTALKNTWEASRKTILSGLADDKVGSELDTPPFIGTFTYGYTGDPFHVNLRMTMKQYLAYVGKTREEYDALVGPAPERAELS
jgi:hypothetical protein